MFQVFKLLQISSIQLTFPFKKGDIDGTEMEERRKFWDSPETIQWFKNHGYTLYQRVVDGSIDFSRAAPSLPFKEFQEADYPYAYHDTEMIAKSTKPLAVYDFIVCHCLIASHTGIHSNRLQGKVVFAQDSQNRHVAIKIVPDNSDEYSILRFLKEESLDVLRENCVIPVLDLLSIKDFWFVIMPRWADNTSLGRHQLYFLLKGGEPLFTIRH